MKFKMVVFIPISFFILRYFSLWSEIGIYLGQLHITEKLMESRLNSNNFLSYLRSSEIEIAMVGSEFSDLIKYEDSFLYVWSIFFVLAVSILMDPWYLDHINPRYHFISRPCVKEIEEKNLTSEIKIYPRDPNVFFLWSHTIIQFSSVH